MNIFILEDDVGYRVPIFKERLAHQKLYFAETAQEGIKLLEKLTEDGVELDYIFLDHDLGGKIFVSSSEENCGVTVAQFISDEGIKTKKGVILHTQNPWGATNMRDILPYAKIIPFPNLIKQMKGY